MAQTQLAALDAAKTTFHAADKVVREAERRAQPAAEWGILPRAGHAEGAGRCGPPLAFGSLETRDAPTACS